MGCAVPIGLPQGSILGPLLFALYINDLPSVITHCCLDLQLYGDDAKLYCSHSDLCVVETCLLSDLHLYAVAAWLRSSHLCINAGKSNFMLIGNCQRVANKSLHVLVGGNLGVLIDSMLSWTLQICNM